jgi:hypothetical protein
MGEFAVPAPCRGGRFSLAAHYRKTLEIAVPRLLGLMNRNPVSATWGCMDRAYWHYQTAVDFPSATYQQPVLALAWLYAAAAPENPFRGKPVLLEAARAGLRFWAGIQHRDGSFDEFYQNERSFCPTAFTSFAASEALLVLAGKLLPGEQAPLLAALGRAGDWLLARDNPQVANQRMAALNALANIAALTGEARFRAGAERLLASLLKSQHAEGWFPEYGGADIGYSFKALDLLGHYYARHGGEALARALVRLLDFAAPFVHPDGTAGGFYGSRNAAHVLPYGLELLAARGFGAAEYLLGLLGEAAAAGQGWTPLAIDDKYLAYFYANSYAGALAAAGEHPGAAVALPRLVVLKGAGLFRLCRGDLYAVGSGIKGGCLKVYHRGRLVFQEAGYFGAFADGACFSSQNLDPAAAWEVEDRGEEVVVRAKSRFVYCGDRPPLARWAVPFKLFTKTALRWGWAAGIFQRLVKARRMGRQPAAPLRLERTLVLGEKGLEIADLIALDQARQVAALESCADATVIPSASTRYTAIGDLAAARLPWDADAALRALNQTGSARIARALSLPAA